MDRAHTVVRVSRAAVVVAVCAALAPASAEAGDDATRITFDPATDMYPSWSPDGSQIAFMSNRSGNYDIWVVPATGGSATQITFDSAFDYDPCWSPDGSQIAFDSNRAGSSDIWVIPAAPPISIDQESWARVKGRYHAK